MPLLRMWYVVCDACNHEYNPDADRRWKAAVDLAVAGWHRVGSSHNTGNRWVCPDCFALGRK